jgi:DNA-binding MarR family transcriptional regulator
MMADERRGLAQLPDNAPVRRRRSGRLAPATQAQADQLDMGGLDRMFGVMLRLAQVASFELFRAATPVPGITPVQFSMIRLIAANPGISQTVLARALNADAPRMVFIIDELERRGLVQRLASTADRRSRAIFLTDAGKRLDRRLTRSVRQQNRQLAERLRGDDPALLLRMLANLTRPV